MAARLISNCSDTKAMPAAFVKADKYADENNFKMVKGQSDVLKMMMACSDSKPPDRPEVKFEDLGKTITVTVGKAKKSTLVIANKLQDPVDPSPMIAAVKTKLDALQKAAGTHMDSLTTTATSIDHFMNVGQEGCNALLVLVKELQKKNPAAKTIGDLKTNANVAAFVKTINENGASADKSIATWDGLSDKAKNMKPMITDAKAHCAKIAPLLVDGGHKTQLKAVQDALAKCEESLNTLIDNDIPRGTKFLVINDSTPLGDIDTKANMSFKSTIKAFEERQKAGTDAARKLRQQHTGDALKKIEALANEV